MKLSSVATGSTRITHEIPHSASQRGGHKVQPGTRRPTLLLIGRVQSVRARASIVGLSSVTLVPQDAGLEALIGETVTARFEGAALEVTGRLGAPTFDELGMLASLDLELDQVTRALARKLTVLASRLDLESPREPEREAVSSQAEEISDPERVATVLRALVSNQSQTLIRAESCDWVLQADSLESDRIHWRIETQGGAPASPLTLESMGYSGVYRLPVLVVAQTDRVLTTTRPKRIWRGRQRRMHRGSPSQAYRASFAHPLWPDERVDVEVIDLAQGGLGILFDPLEDLLTPGMTIPALAVRRDGLTVATFTATVRTAPPQVGGRSTSGLEIKPRTPLDARVWRRVVSEVLHEASQDFPTDPQHVWDLFCESGYLNLSGKQPSEFEELRSSFVRSSKKLRAAPEMSCQVVWPSADGVAASVTQLKVYSGSWLDFHLAKVGGKFVDGIPGRRILRDIHLHSIEHLLADSGMRWFMGYIQDDGSRFSKLAMLEFLNRVSDDKDACGVPFTAVEIPAATGLAAVPADVREATPEEQLALVATIRSLRPEAYCLAHDYTEAEIDLPSVRATWQTAGLSRDRCVLVATEHGEAVAAAILETGEDGLHLFGLLDCVRLFPIQSGGERAFDRLLTAAASWYASVGKSRFVLFDEWNTEVDAALSPRNLGRAICAILSDRLIPDYLDHFFEWMAWAPTGASQYPPALGAQEESGLIKLPVSA